MKSKWIIASILILVLIALCAASLFTVWQGVLMAKNSGIHFRSYSPYTVTATATEVKNLTVSGPASLNVQNDTGDITVRTGNDGQVNIKAEKTTWGNGDADAQAALKQVQIIVKQDGNAISVSVQQPTQVGMFGVEPSGGRVKFTITVPKASAATLHSSNGDVSLDGITGNADAESDFGKVTLSNISGSVLGKSSNGTVSASNISSSGSIDLSSNFGRVTLDTVSGSDVTAASDNGQIVLKNVTTSGALKIDDQFGGIDLSSSQAASLHVKTSNGQVKLDQLNITGASSVESDFGTLTLTGGKAASYDLSTQNGKIGLDGAQGPIKAHSDFGDVTVSNAQNATIDLSSNNGSVSFSGSLGTGPHSIKSDFGNIHVTLPAASALNINLQTGFGKISSDFSITVKGAIDDKHSVGSINGGGPVLTINTNNGNITLQSSK